jgi:hypothetical protein
VRERPTGWTPGLALQASRPRRAGEQARDGQSAVNDTGHAMSDDLLHGSRKAPPPARLRVRLHRPDPHPAVVTAAGRNGWALDWMCMHLRWSSRLHF